MAIDINIYNESFEGKLPKKKISDAVMRVFAAENVSDAKIDIVLCNDNYIHSINKEFLSHDYATDVITFNLDEEILTGEIYISYETATIQAKEYKVSLTNELMRLAVHGALHLLGYDDADDESRQKMHELENKYIS